MTELITGAKGSAHVTSAQQGAINAYTIGTGAYILDGCATTLPSANTLHIAAGHLMVQGRAIEVTATDLTIANGTQGTKRHDLVCLAYAKSGSPIVEVATLKVVQGTASANPVDPAVTGSILNGDATAQIPLWRISLDGITPTVETLAIAYSYGPTQIAGSGDNYVILSVRHRIVTVMVRWTSSGGSWDSAVIAYIPAAYAPLMRLSAQAVKWNKSATGETIVMVRTDGAVSWGNLGATQDAQIFEATLTWGI